MTESGSHEVPAGSGGGGSRLQSTAGFVNTAPVVVIAKRPATDHVHSYDTIAPGAEDVLALNVHASVWPLFAISQVSVSVGPVTPNRAVAAAGFVIVTVADADAPPYDAVMVDEETPAPGFVAKLNIALVAPPFTTTTVGIVNPAPPESATLAPSVGAAAVSVTVPVLLAPSTTVASEIARFARATTRGVTVSKTG